MVNFQDISNPNQEFSNYLEKGCLIYLMGSRHLGNEGTPSNKNRMYSSLLIS